MTTSELDSVNNFTTEKLPIYNQNRMKVTTTMLSNYDQLKNMQKIVALKKNQISK